MSPSYAALFRSPYRAMMVAALGATWPESGANFLLCEFGDRAESIYRTLKDGGLLVRWWSAPDLRTS